MPIWYFVPFFRTDFPNTLKILKKSLQPRLPTPTADVNIFWSNFEYYKTFSPAMHFLSLKTVFV